LARRIEDKIDFSKVYQVRKLGKDADPIFWSFGKIHGLENIAYVDEKELLACEGDPVAIQKLVNKIKPEDIDGFSSF